MKIKFKKGMTPEIMAQTFVKFIRQNNLVIGAVTMYIQTYDEEMKPVKFNEEDYFEAEPTEEMKKIYANDISEIRRSKMKVV